MIDHISISVRDLESAGRFYESVLSHIGYLRLVEKPGTTGFGKKYPDFWLNHRPAKTKSGGDDGFHFCLRAGSRAQVEAFYEEAVSQGATSDGAPGLRANYSSNYFAAFIIDRDGNKIEVVTFLNEKPIG